MKSSIIPKEDANKYNIETFYAKIHTSSEPTLVDKILELNPEISDEEKAKIDKILETFFLYRNPNIELSRKFRDFFEKEVEKHRGITQSQKFVDFLISKKISGSWRRKQSSIIEEDEKQKAIPVGIATVSTTEENQGYPRLIRNDEGEITAIEVQCKCGEIIHIDIEFD
jgi:hypothetical protein